MCRVVCGAFCLLSLTVSDCSFERARMHARTRPSTKDKYTRTHKHTPCLSNRLTDVSTDVSPDMPSATSWPERPLLFIKDMSTSAYPDNDLFGLSNH